MNDAKRLDEVMTEASKKVSHAVHSIALGLAELREAQALWLKAHSMSGHDPVGTLIKTAYSSRIEYGGGPLNISNITDMTRREAALYLAANFDRWTGEQL